VGTYLAIDVGGTKLAVGVVEHLPARHRRAQVSSVRPDPVMLPLAAATC
jgi:hexokinase